MQAATVHTAISSTPVRSGRLPDALAFVLLASIIVAFLAGSSAPTPLFTLYQAAWGFSPITTTIVFGVYALGVLAALLTVGSLSDYVGRRPVLLVAIGLQALGVLLMAETHTTRPGALASLHPRFAVPAATRRPFAAAVPALVAVWSLAGLYGALSPALVRQLAGTNSFVLAGLTGFVLAGSGAVTVLLARAAAPRTVLVLGTVALLAGVGITLLAISHPTAAGFFIGTAVAGVGFGAGFQGALRTVLPLAAPHERAGVLSLLYVVSYLALGLPAVIAGFLVVHGGGILPTAREYGVAVMALALLALLDVVVPGRRHPAGPALTPDQPDRP